MIEPSDRENEFLKQGKLISAIKSLRDRTGMNLKDCILAARAWNGSCPHGWRAGPDGKGQRCPECE